MWIRTLASDSGNERYVNTDTHNAVGVQVNGEGGFDIYLAGSGNGVSILAHKSTQAEANDALENLMSNVGYETIV